MQVFNLQAVWSDHSPIVVDTEYRNKKSPRAFRFEVGWMDYEDCEMVAPNGWNMQFEGSKVFQVVQKLKRCNFLLKI